MPMSSKFILGIDTSNYKTSIAVTDQHQTIVCDIRRLLKVKQGERGLRQSDALFQHIKNLPEMMEEMRKQFSGEIGAIAYSAKPRPVDGSYMPVFLAGESFARALSSAMNIPCAAFSHQEGHIEAIKAFSPFQKEKELLACHFSGGTSELLKVTAKCSDAACDDTGCGDTVGYKIDIIGGSKDIAFGQVLDRAGVAMGMEFPAGEEMDRIALGIDEHYGSITLTPIKVIDAWLNLSGIDTQIKNRIAELMPQSISNGAWDPKCGQLIKEVFDKLADAMGKMVLQGVAKTGNEKVILAGGVASSKYIRQLLTPKLREAGISAVFDDKGLSQDNAVGIALLGGKQLWQ